LNITSKSGIIRFVNIPAITGLLEAYVIKRTIIKLSGEAIGDSQSASGYNDTVVDSIVRQVISAIHSGTQVSLVVGGGNLWRGRQARPDMDRVKADYMGMLATVMNAIYLAEAFKRQGAEALVMTPMPVANMTRVYEKDLALGLMASQTVIINAAGTGHPFLSTDTITALRAAELEADIVLYAKNIDGVYNSDPNKDNNARKYKSLSYDTAIRNGLNAADIAAMHISKEAGTPTYIFGLNIENSISLACAYPNTENLNGTFMHEDIKEDYYV